MKAKSNIKKYKYLNHSFQHYTLWNIQLFFLVQQLKWQWLWSRGNFCSFWRTISHDNEKLQRKKGKKSRKSTEGVNTRRKIKVLCRIAHKIKSCQSQKSTSKMHTITGLGSKSVGQNTMPFVEGTVKLEWWQYDTAEPMLGESSLRSL